MDSQFERFKKYMDAPCTELHEKDAGRNDPHRVAFQEWGVPQEFLLWLWQAAEAAALERAAQWYVETGWLLDEDDVPDAIRKLAAPVERGGE
jgi:hypothetical protein